jgi:hypothetical protein
MEEVHEEAHKAIDAVNPGCLVVFPNPTSGDLRLDLKEHIGRSAEVQVHDGTGKVMLRTRINDINSESSRLDVSAFPGGSTSQPCRRTACRTCRSASWWTGEGLRIKSHRGPRLWPGSRWKTCTLVLIFCGGTARPAV